MIDAVMNDARARASKEPASLQDTVPFFSLPYKKNKRYPLFSQAIDKTQFDSGGFSRFPGVFFA